MLMKIFLSFPRLASSLIDAYEDFFELSHGNVVKVLEIYPMEEHIMIKYHIAKMSGGVKR